MIVSPGGGRSDLSRGGAAEWRVREGDCLLIAQFTWPAALTKVQHLINSDGDGWSLLIAQFTCKPLLTMTPFEQLYDQGEELLNSCKLWRILCGKYKRGPAAWNSKGLHIVKSHLLVSSWENPAQHSFHLKPPTPLDGCEPFWTILNLAVREGN